MFRVTRILFVLFAFAALVVSQTTKPCTCTSIVRVRQWYWTRTLSGSASCTNAKLTPTCPTSTVRSTSSSVRTTPTVTPTPTTRPSSSSSSSSPRPTSTSSTPTSTARPSSSSTPTPTPTPTPTSTPRPSSSSSPSPSPSLSPTSSPRPSSSSTPTPSPSTSTPRPSSSSTPTPTPSSTTSTPRPSSSSSPTPSPSTFSPRPSSSSSSSTSTRSSTTSSTPTSCVPTPTPNNGKRGIGYNSTPLSKLFSLSCPKSKVSWSYNWYSSPASDGQTAAYNSALQFIPMLWSAHPDLTSVWNANVNAAIGRGSKALLAFNEPDGCADGGSCMDVAASVKGYKDWMQPFAGKARLGAPAVTNGGAPMGLDYLKRFLGSCNGCTVDFVPIHWYSDANNVDYFKSFVQEAYAAAGNRPLWITEFGCTSGTDAQIQTFMKTVLPWLDSLSYVEKYSYFGAIPANPAGGPLWGSTLVNQAGTALSQTGVTFDQY